MPVIILQSLDETETVPISIGPFEASAVITELENIHPPRPLTHDLFSEMLKKHNFRLTSLEIYKAVQEKFFARLHYRRNFKRFSIEVRPSDGIALIIRHGGEIKTNRDVLTQCSGNYHLYSSDDLSRDFLFLKNNSNDRTFM